MLHRAPAAMFDHYLGISRLLAGQLDFRSAIRSVAAEVAHIIPHDHLDVCVLLEGGNYHTAYETGIETAWGDLAGAPVVNSPIRSLLRGEVDFLLADDAMTDQRFHFEGAFKRPIVEESLRSRLHVPMKVQGTIIAALSCSSRTAGVYTMEDIERARIIADLLTPYFFALQAAEQAQRSAIVEAEARAREEGLRQGALKLTEALEQERQRIGMDLHDQTLADLTRLARRIDRLSRNGEVTPEALEPVSRSLQHCMQDLRQIIEQAKPSVLQLFGLAQAIEHHLDRSTRDTGSAIEWGLVDETHGALERLEPTVSVALFRIAQEAINNAVRHAAPLAVTVRLEADEERLSIEIFDDGSGLAKARGRIGGGIDNMKTRARLISARFTTGPGHNNRGTVVRVVLPLTPHDPASGPDRGETR
ncbi:MULTISPECIES: GAF domain-containing sensor histidine kinase [unclassified Rhizobium]|uniref:GAF domain-containing sensor histidine kinase n=1 Tax=unclassified Rhizobium TaxID=2613769 RepID=UPI0007E9A49F|nr:MULTISPECIES: sensor histidine kinase [unclassified Rhizobium]ANM14174.1 sensor histidine kinase protein [Rhizobium sp. N324]ANM20556.1 sensor histidine kinase protein [Rhizobium sp. N541]ANM26940.1 sensor histidine kinase protein [Rhizobium sp. N941]OWV66031.1 ATPase [Rhizobium sp. N122]OYD00347.1 sensor histidine kinase protein [Rhizobium sp. N4311]